ncbi:hypothetical protein G9A89_021381 [Geosiphon pyriformis]|nr:hypothetical protein G9A89_021381 [Geosiphon pyriformis]
MANVAMFSNKFAAASRFSDLDTIWDVIRKDNDYIFTKGSSRFYRLELLVLKIVRAFHGGGVDNFVSLIECWCSLNSVEALVVQDLIDSSVFFDCVCSVLSGARKSYCALKLAESLRAKEANIKSTIDKKMESFEMDKGYTIKSVLKCPFCKVVLDHLVVDNELVLESSLSGHIKSWAGFFSFFAAGAFVDNTIWVGSSQNATQHIFNVASEFFRINDIFINNEKMVAILINSEISNLSLFINGSPITIARKGEFHWYLDIFLLTESFLKPSLAKMHLDVRFFTNLVLRKAVLDKQFLYLVSVVLHSIVSYRMQFSFVSIGVYNKWDALIHKSLKLKSGLPLDFPCDTIHHSFFYGLKSFLQIQSETVEKIGPYGSVPEWFKLSAAFFNDVTFSPTHSTALCNISSLNILKSSNFVSICNHFLQVDTSILSVYTDRFLKNLKTVNCQVSAAAFFEDIGLSLGVDVSGLMSSTLAKFKNLRVSWHKVKGHSGVLGNECVNVIAGITSLLDWCLSPCIDEHFIVANDNIVSDNSKHFVHDIFCSVCYAHWKVGSGCKFLKNSLLSEIDWIHFSLVWHPDLHMATGLTSLPAIGYWTPT